MSVQRALYRQLLQMARYVRKQGLPCTGGVGLPSMSGILCPEAFVASSFRTNSGEQLQDAFHAMRVLPRQVAVLQASEEETRQALQQWQELQQHWCSRMPLISQQQLEAAESAAWLLQRLASQQAQQQLLLEEDMEQLQQQTESSIKAAQQQLDDWATAVKMAVPEAFVAGACNSLRTQQLEALYKVLCQQNKLRCDPFEWVYEGLDPLMLPAVVHKRKGIPLSLTVVAGAVARRLGMEAQLVCADDSQVPGTASGPLLMQQMPPEVAARQAGRSLAGAPPPTTWLLQLIPAEGQQWGPGDLGIRPSWGPPFLRLPYLTQNGFPAVFLDFSQKGMLLDAAACTQRYPLMESTLQQQQQQQEASNQHLSCGTGCSIVRVWASMARTMVMAHQRRGESDLVAHWLYQLLALDTAAEEWAHAMQQ